MIHGSWLIQVAYTCHGMAWFLFIVHCSFDHFTVHCSVHCSLLFIKGIKEVRGDGWTEEEPPASTVQSHIDPTT
jgi:hypothetical protein